MDTLFTLFTIFYVVPSVFCLLISVAGLIASKSKLRLYTESMLFAVTPALNMYMSYLYITGFIETRKAKDDT